ncbi:hypothetical protein [Pseudofrankia sp. EUN1h]|nr:hypothetical protein [Pseudofrankia sp. EUN1h]
MRGRTVRQVVVMRQIVVTGAVRARVPRVAVRAGERVEALTRP